MAKQRILMVIVIISMICVCKAVFQCSPGVYQCHLYTWSAWSTCSSSCGGGVSTRYKTICCSLNLKSYSDCAAFCNYTADDYLDKMVCGKSCLHGAFNQNSCQCPSKFTGKCCENGNTYIEFCSMHVLASYSIAHVFHALKHMIHTSTTKYN